MLDETKWAKAVARLQGLRANHPGWIKLEHVDEYHSVVEAFEGATNESFSEFQIPRQALKPRLISSTRATFRNPNPKKIYSDKPYCDDATYNRTIDGLWHYVQTLQSTMNSGKVTTVPVDYWKLTDSELEALADEYKIGGFGHAHGIDRTIIINALVQRDQAMSHATPSGMNFGDVTGSVIQVGTSHSQATVTFNAQDVRAIVEKIKSKMDQLQLTEAEREELTTDIQTIEPQLVSAKPKPGIVAACLNSMKTTLSTAAKTAITAEIAQDITHVLQLLHHHH